MDNQIAVALQSLETQLNEQVVQLQGIRPIWEQDATNLFEQVNGVVFLDSDHKDFLEKTEQDWFVSLDDFKSGAHKVEQEVNVFLNHFDQKIQDTKSVLKQHQNDWQAQVQQKFNQILENIENNIADIQSKWTDKNEDLNNFVNDLEDRLNAGKEMLEAQWTSSIENMESRQTSHFEALFNKHKDVLADYSDNLLSNIVNDETTLIDATLNNFADYGVKTAEAMGKEVSDLMQNVQKQVGNRVTSTIEEMMDQFIEDVLVKMATEIQEGLMTTTVGAATTTTLSPILPELKAIKLASDAILQAIEVWKKLKELGGF